MIEISKRLKMIASFVPAGSVLADVGTDHAYLPIYLVQNMSVNRVIAMDVKRGPLKKAARNISEAKAEDSIELRLSDGLSALMPDEADAVAISGMGGRLMERILSEGADKISSRTKLIFSPQSEIMHFRKYLLENGFITDNEQMLEEDGKYYVIIVCHKAASNEAFENVSSEETVNHAQLKYGKILIDSRNSVLAEFVKSELKTYEELKNKLKQSSSVNAKQRILQIDKEIQAIHYVLGR